MSNTLPPVAADPVTITIQAQTAGGELEQLALQFGREGLLPAVIQEANSGEVLLVAFMNLEAFELTCRTGQVHFWSRSRQQLWHKGETSGDFLLVESLYVNCEVSSILLKVRLAGKAACHTGHKSCYYRQVKLEK